MSSIRMSLFYICLSFLLGCWSRLLQKLTYTTSYLINQLTALLSPM